MNCRNTLHLTLELTPDYMLLYMGSQRRPDIAAVVQIGKAAQQTGLSVDTIRFYEKQELVPTPLRTSGGYRMYAQEHIERLKFIGRAQDLGFSLHEIRELLLLENNRVQSCVHVRNCIEEKIASVHRKILALKRLESRLKTARGQCSDAIQTLCDSGCPVLHSMQARRTNEESG